MSYETKRAIDIFQNHDLLILNGRYGPNSAETTFQTNVSTETTIDYALCHQGFFPRVNNMAICKNNLAGIASDHFPIILSAQCEGTDPEKSEQSTTEWWEEETRELLDMSPFALPAEDPERISLIDKYQQSLARGLAQPLRELHRLQQ